MNNIIWTVRVVSAPVVRRYCKRCGADAAFLSSGMFRVNAQQKNLDVWLIYKCSLCDTTWNMTVLTRVKPGSIPPELLAGFHRNDPALAMRYASDTALLRQNGGEPGLPGIRVDGGELDPGVPARLFLRPEWPLEIKAAVVLREKLGLSRSRFDAWCDSGTLRSASGRDLRKAKLTKEVVVEICP